MAKQKYNEDSIKVYEGLTAVRKRPHMYLGKSGSPMVFQMLREIVENSSDEHDAGHNDFIGVVVNKVKQGQEFIVIDKGRGIPVGIHKKTKISTLTTVFTKLHAGGKFDDKSYESSRGVHGVGSACCNAVSSEFEVWTHRDGKWYHQAYKEGKEVTKVKKTKAPKKYLKSVKTTSKTAGTVVRFIPDYPIVGQKAEIKLEKLQTWLNDIAQLNSGLKIQLVYGKFNKIYHNPGGAKTFLKRLVEDKKTEVLGRPFLFESKNLSVGIQWTDYTGEDGIISYVNGAPTNDGGTHVKGLFKAVDAAFTKFKGKKSKGKGGKWTASDVRFGLVGFINYKLHNAEYDSQTKNELVTTKAVKDVAELLGKSFDKFLDQNKATARKILKRAVDIKKTKEDMKKLLKAASQIKKSAKASMPGKLLSCDKKTPAEKRELFLVEGDSAGGSAKKARNSKYQMVLPLRGKCVNAAKEKMSKVLQNKEVMAILVSIGADPKTLGTDKDRKYSVGKIIITADADHDGKHITQLILTILYTLVPDTFKKKMVYVVECPLYQANVKGKKVYGFSLKEMQKKLKGHKANITRMKGLGEANWPDLKSFAFEPENRKMYRIDAISGKDKVKFLKVVGEDTSTRKKILGIN